MDMKIDMNKIEQLAKDFVKGVEKYSDPDWQYCDRLPLARRFVAEVVVVAGASNLRVILEHIDKEIATASEAMETSPVYDEDRPYWKGYKEGAEEFKRWVEEHSKEQR